MVWSVLCITEILPIWLRTTINYYNQIWISFAKECYVPILVEISPVVLLHDIFKSFQCILSILIKYPLQKRCVLHLIRFEFSLPKHGMCLVIGDTAVLEKKILKWQWQRYPLMWHYADRYVHCPMPNTVHWRKCTVNDTHWQRRTQSNNSYTDRVAHMTHTSTLIEMFSLVTQSLTEI